MRKVARPTDPAMGVFLTCISKIRNEDLKSRLTSVATNIADAETAFENAAAVARLHTLHTHSDVGGRVSGQEMSDVYDLRMAKQETPGRPFYDKLIAAVTHSRCPLCAQRVVSTLDHHLPKSQFPALAVCPINLIPACADCNKLKLDVVPDVAEEQTLHPYFDDVENERWLYARIVRTAPAAARFFVETAAVRNPVRAARVRHHVTTFKLTALYASHAADELVNIRHGLQKLFLHAGVAGVKAHLREKAESCFAAHTNSWQTALYSALAEDDWYCSGGFQA